MSLIDLTIVPRDKDLDGFMVRRILPFAKRRMVGPFIFLDHIWGPLILLKGKVSMCARTRTLIQLDGLIEKSELLDWLDIYTGADLQKDEEMYSPLLQLLGALCDLQTQMIEEPSSPQSVGD